jgi:tetratricopeptide (TPR) repeat protein
VIAAHLVDVHRAGAGDPDAADLRARARAALARAAERAGSLASAAAAAEAFAHAAELADDPVEQAELLERAGLASLQDGALEQAAAQLARAAALVEEAGVDGAALRIASRRAEVFRSADRVGEAIALLAPAYAAAPKDIPNTDVARAAAELARAAYFAGQRELTAEAVEVALEMAEALQLPDVLAEALTTKAILIWRRPHEALALVKEALAVAREHGLGRPALRAQFNLTGMLMEHDRLAEARRELESALALARQRGDRDWENPVLGQLVDVLVKLGEWDEAEAMVGALEPVGPAPSIGLSPSIHLFAERGELDRARALFDEHQSMRGSTDLQARASLLEGEAVIRRHEGRYAEAIEAAKESLELWRAIGEQHYAIETLAEAAQAAFDGADLDEAERLLDYADSWPLIERRPLLAPHTARLRAKLLAARGEDAGDLFAQAAAQFRELGRPFWTAVTLFDAGRMEEAEPIFERLGAEPWLERMRTSIAR